MNIQVDNVCQVLSQFRVQSFVKQNPEDLFHRTQLSVCSNETIKQFNELVKLSESQIDNLSAKNTMMVQHEEMKKIEKYSVAADYITQRNEITIGRDSIYAKLICNDYKKSNRKCKEIEVELKRAQQNAQEKENEYTKLKKEAEEITEKQNQLKTMHHNQSRARETHENDFNKIVKKMKTLKGDIKKAKHNLENIKKSAADHEKNIQECRLLQNAAQSNYDDLEKKIASSRKHDTESNTQKTQVQNQIEMLKSEEAEINKSIATLCQCVENDREKCRRPRMSVNVANNFYRKTTQMCTKR